MCLVSQCIQDAYAWYLHTLIFRDKGGNNETLSESLWTLQLQRSRDAFSNPKYFAFSSPPCPHSVYLESFVFSSLLSPQRQQCPSECIAHGYSSDRQGPTRPAKSEESTGGGRRRRNTVNGRHAGTVTR